jgi:anaerobic ribonucleoside-triphosphate reductase activating protein
MQFDAVVNVAEVSPGTRALGPGLRAVVWVQGCPFRCPECVAPEWIPDRPARVVGSAQLAEELLVDPAVVGLTFSGGEPMAQAGGLAATVRAARSHRDLTLICFTGYRLETLATVPDADELLGEVDVLIDGLYVSSRNDGTGLRGSTNQQVHHLTDRLSGSDYDFQHGPRRAELTITGSALLLVGLPPPGLAGWLRSPTALGVAITTGSTGEEEIR